MPVPGTRDENLLQGILRIMADRRTGLSLKVLKIYREIDQKTARLQSAFGLRCPHLCGACCDNPEVEATVLETLPLAEEIYLRNELDSLLGALEERRNQADFRCVLFLANPGVPGTGMCSCYRFRPLVCRLFVFAARRNKFGNLELSTCKLIKLREPEAVRKAETAISEGRLDVAVYQNSFMRIASLQPGIGFRRLPINVALKEALERFW